MNNIIIRHMRNFHFLLLTFGTGVFYFCFYAIGLVTGFGLSFTIAGIPLLTHVLRTTSTFREFERLQTKIYTDISIPVLDERRQPTGSLWMQAKQELLNSNNWNTVLWLMLKLIIGIGSLLCAVVLYVIPLLMLLTPFLYPIVEMNFLNMSVQSLESSLVVCGLGMIGMIASYWLSNRIIMIVGSYSRLLFK
ncbi:sensor domain-containing protein [Paenibacillus sp. UMB4589-SE434]|uniref:sensor domain-containing protein n=1 Tax=Paenibacillus sp. UMB4589-SE434 TaxID=3046314 RepID=UPI0025507209|nr:sensor domain-containing protein [Paenibacillus sp. UMB4589-SE434]MDK8181814.1 sensor domain-containing protein [Paenibacillus sp. UMB4589-SE434]